VEKKRALWKNCTGSGRKSIYFYNQSEEKKKRGKGERRIVGRRSQRRGREGLKCFAPPIQAFRGEGRIESKKEKEGKAASKIVVGKEEGA